MPLVVEVLGKVAAAPAADADPGAGRDVEGGNAPALAVVGRPAAGTAPVGVRKLVSLLYQQQKFVLATTLTLSVGIIAMLLWYCWALATLYQAWVDVTPEDELRNDEPLGDMKAAVDVQARLGTSSVSLLANMLALALITTYVAEFCRLDTETLKWNKTAVWVVRVGVVIKALQAAVDWMVPSNLYLAYAPISTIVLITILSFVVEPARPGKKRWLWRRLPVVVSSVLVLYSLIVYVIWGAYQGLDSVGARVVARLVVFPMFVELLLAPTRRLARAHVDLEGVGPVMCVALLPMLMMSVIGRFMVFSIGGPLETLLMSLAIGAVELLMRGTTHPRDRLYARTFGFKLDGETARVARSDLRVVEELCENLGCVVAAALTLVFRINWLGRGSPDPWSVVGVALGQIALETLIEVVAPLMLTLGWLPVPEEFASRVRGFLDLTANRCAKRWSRPRQRALGVLSVMTVMAPLSALLIAPGRFMCPIEVRDALLVMGEC